jgi:hypothetical protein
LRHTSASFFLSSVTSLKLDLCVEVTVILRNTSALFFSSNPMEVKPLRFEATMLGITLRVFFFFFYRDLIEATLPSACFSLPGNPHVKFHVFPDHLSGSPFLVAPSSCLMSARSLGVILPVNAIN